MRENERKELTDAIIWLQANRGLDLNNSTKGQCVLELWKELKKYRQAFEYACIDVHCAYEDYAVEREDIPVEDVLDTEEEYLNEAKEKLYGGEKDE